MDINFCFDADAEDDQAFLPLPQQQHSKSTSLKRCVGASYHSDQPIKKEINELLASIANQYLQSKSSDCLILDSELLLTCNALHQTSGINFDRMIVPNPDPDIIAIIRQTQPEIRCLEMTTHDLLSSSNNLLLLPNPIAFCYLDYNSSFGRVGFKTGKKRRGDIEKIFAMQLLSLPISVLAMTFSLRGITESWENEHFEAALKFVQETAAEKGDRCFHFLTGRKYHHSTSQMMFLVGLVTSKSMIVERVPILSLSIGTELCLPQATEQRIQLSSVALGLVPWIAEMFQEKNLYAYVSATKNALGPSIAHILSNMGWTMHDASPRPRNWWIEGKEAPSPLHCVWMCDEGSVHFGKTEKKNRPCPIQWELEHVIRGMQGKDVCVCLHVTISTMDQRWLGEQRDRIRNMMLVNGGRVLGIAEYQGASTAAVFAACYFGERKVEPPARFPSVNSFVWSDPVHMSSVKPIAMHVNVEKMLAKHAAVLTEHLGLQSRRAMVMDYPTCVWSKEMGIPKGSVVVLKDPFEQEISSETLEEHEWESLCYSPASVLAIHDVGVMVWLFNSPMSAEAPQLLLKTLAGPLLLVFGCYTTSSSSSSGNEPEISQYLSCNHRCLGEVRVKSSVERVYYFVQVGTWELQEEEEDHGIHLEESWATLQAKKMVVTRYI